MTYRNQAGVATPSLDPRVRPSSTGVEVRCLCDCNCHNVRCYGVIEPGQKDCPNDCRGTESTVVCDPFIERV